MKDFIQFIKTDIWHANIRKMPRWKGNLYRFFRILLLTHQGFSKSQIQQGASSLTYYSLLAVVPIIALLIGIARGFLLESDLEAWIIQHFSEQKEIAKQIFKFANTSLEQARGGVIAGIGIAILVWAAIKILVNIELVMNQIWEIKQERTLAQKFKDYLALVFLAPIIIFLASGLTGYLSALLSSVKKEQAILEHIAPYLVTILSVISFLLISFLFTFLYAFMPNTKVRLLPALIAGLITGIIYQILQWFYFYFQIGVASYNAIYGTFAAFPLFLIWLHLSWLIILMGAKLAFAIQNVDAYEYITQKIALSHRLQIICSLRIAHLCIKRQQKELPPPSMIEISNLLEIPHLLTTQLVGHLVKSGVLVEVKKEDKEDAFQPALSIESLTLKRVIDMIDTKGATLHLPTSSELSLILNNLEKFDHAIENSKGNVLLKNIN